MGHAPPRRRQELPENNDALGAVFEPSALVVLFVFMVLVLEHQLLLLGYLIAGIGIIMILWGLGLGIKHSIKWMRANAYTHTDEWQQEREKIFWVEYELAPPCKTVGHDEEDGRCIWCDKVLDMSKLPVAKHYAELNKRITESYAVPTHHLAER